MAEAYAIEQALIALLVEPTTDRLKDMRRLFLLRWAREFHTIRGAQEGPKLILAMRDLSADVTKIQLRPQAGIIDAARRGIEIGLKQASIEAGSKTLPLHVPLDPGVWSYAAGVERAVAEKLAFAKTLAANTKKATMLQATRPLDAVGSAVHVVEQSVTTVFHEHLNLAADAVVEHLGALKMWVAEPDACPLCLPLSGRIVPAGGVFPAVLTHGSRLIDWIPDSGLTGPPLHPRCRCRLTPLIR